MASKPLEQRLEAAYARAVARGVERSRELRCLLADLRRKGYRVRKMVIVGVQLDPPPLKRFPRKLGRADRAFLQGLGIAPE